MNKKQQEEQRRQEDQALKRGLLWVVGAAVVECLLFLLNRYAIDFEATAQGVAVAESLLKAMSVLRIVGALAFVVGGVLAVMQLKKGGKFMKQTALCVAGAVVMVCAHVVWKYNAGGLRMLYLLIPVLGGLALCSHIYTRDFFLGALPAVLGVLGLWFVRAGGIGPEVILTVLACAAVLALAVMLKKGGGTLKLGQTELELLPRKSDCHMPMVSAGVALAAQLLGMVAGGMIAYYLIFAMGAWLFALLVYFTVKML